MNTKLSGAQLVLVPIRCVGKNYFPYVENIRDRVIKFIDYCETLYLPNITGESGMGTPTNQFVTLIDETGAKKIHNNLPLQRLWYAATNGIRQNIFCRLSLDNCYIDNQDAAMVGKTAAFVVWYDLPQFSSANKSTKLITDSISVPIVNATRYNPFPDADRMTGKRFRRIFSNLPTQTPDLQTGVDQDAFVNMFVTLRKGSYNVVENVPLYLFFQLYQQYQMEFANIVFDFESSYLTLGGAGTYPNADTDVVGKSVFFNLQYEA